MNDVGKMLIRVGLLLVVGGAVVVLLGRWNIPIGRLPGDLSWKSKSGGTQFYFPVVTCIVVSVLLSLVMWIVNSFRR
jgi:hypothetical protein